MAEHANDIEALAQAFELLTNTTKTMEEAYRRLESRVHELDRELADKNRELALTYEYLSNLLDSMSDGVVAVDTHGIVTRFNRSATIILGYEASEVIAKPFQEIFGRDFPAPRNPGAMELRSKSGRHVPISEHDSTISDLANKHLGSVKTFHDLSELIALREHVRQIDRLAAIGEMAATVAHEIRNPLGGIRGFATFLSQDIPVEDPRRRLVDKIIEGTKSLDKVVTELLEYTRPVDLNLVPASCRAIVDGAISFLNLDTQRITLRNGADPSLNVWADADKIRRVFLNIILNAAQSIEKNGDIHIRTHADDSYVTVVFEDTGCGMDEAHLKKIFSPFFTTKEKGTGLGMAICAKIIEAHGGDLKAQSKLGEGTSIAVRLPRTE
jgi:PAS domain S-box-containing protein